MLDDVLHNFIAQESDVILYINLTVFCLKNYFQDFILSGTSAVSACIWLTPLDTGAILKTL